MQRWEPRPATKEKPGMKQLQCLQQFLFRVATAKTMHFIWQGVSGIIQVSAWASGLLGGSYGRNPK